jgi:hypothetical protein
VKTEKLAEEDICYGESGNDANKVSDKAASDSMPGVFDTYTSEVDG